MRVGAVYNISSVTVSWRRWSCDFGQGAHVKGVRNMSSYRACGVLVLGCALFLTGCQGTSGPQPNVGSFLSTQFANSHSIAPNAACLGDVDPFKLADAAPENFAVLGLGSPTNISITGPSRVFGKIANVGVAGASKFSMSDGYVGGQVILSSAASTNITGPSIVKGGTVINDALLTSAVACADQASQFYAGLPATSGTPSVINISNPSGDITIAASAHVTVVDLTDLVLNGGSTVTLTASQPAKFVINDTGRFVLQGGSRIVVAGALLPVDVLFNVVGTGQDVAMGGGTHNGVPTSQAYGILLALQRNISLSPGLVRPEVIGGGAQIDITSGGQVIDRDP